MTCDHDFQKTPGPRECSKCGERTWLTDEDFAKVEASSRAIDETFARQYFRELSDTADRVARRDNPEQPRRVVDQDGKPL